MHRESTEADGADGADGNGGEYKHRRQSKWSELVRTH
jgi:hypothetical protein